MARIMRNLKWFYCGIVTTCIVGGVYWGGGSVHATDLDVNLAHDTLLAEATGYFKHAGGTGGKGGSVYFVTNLNDSGTGSLRAGLTQNSAAIVLFENGLSGTINVFWFSVKRTPTG